MVRQANLYFPENRENELIKDRIAANTAAFAKALRNFLRGPTNDETLRGELDEMAVRWISPLLRPPLLPAAPFRRPSLARPPRHLPTGCTPCGGQAAGLMSPEQVDACMAASNRPMFCLNAMSANLREAQIDSMDRARVDTTISTLVDLTGACERIFKSPVPLVYTRHVCRSGLEPQASSGAPTRLLTRSGPRVGADVALPDRLRHRAALRAVPRARQLVEPLGHRARLGLHRLLPARHRGDRHPGESAPRPLPRPPFPRATDALPWQFACRHRLHHARHRHLAVSPTADSRRAVISPCPDRGALLDPAARGLLQRRHRRHHGGDGQLEAQQGLTAGRNCPPPTVRTPPPRPPWSRRKGRLTAQAVPKLTILHVFNHQAFAFEAKAAAAAPRVAATAAPLPAPPTFAAPPPVPAPEVQGVVKVRAPRPRARRARALAATPPHRPRAAPPPLSASASLRRTPHGPTPGALLLQPLVEAGAVVSASLLKDTAPAQAVPTRPSPRRVSRA